MMIGILRSKKQATTAKVLIVDDEPDIVNIIKCHLECCKCEVVTAANGKEGLEKAAKEKPDLILLDVNMPTMNGLQMLERLREDPNLKDIPVIMVTVVCEPQNIAVASSYSVADYISKPFELNELAEKVAKALNI
ncbi:MAG TPA: response regulator [bacterium]|nr:response regulator [bacterium]